MTRNEFIHKLLLLPTYIEIEFISEMGESNVTDAELEAFTARYAINRLQGTDLGERPRLLVLLPRGIRSRDQIDKELDAAFEELQRLKAITDDLVEPEVIS